MERHKERALTTMPSLGKSAFYGFEPDSDTPSIIGVLPQKVEEAHTDAVQRAQKEKLKTPQRTYTEVFL